MARIETILKDGLDDAPTGTKASRYSDAAEGPFRCDHCMHYSDDSCNHPIVMADRELEHNEHGDAVVEDGGCCTYFRKKEKSHGR